jgi:hypothetical protein
MSQKFSAFFGHLRCHFSYPPTGGSNDIFATLPSGSVGVATLKIKREQIEKGDLEDGYSNKPSRQRGKNVVISTGRGVVQIPIQLNITGK